MLKEYTYKLR